ncbi:unnamed protein product [Rhodiola kirilowii]
MVDSKPVMEQFNELTRILGQFTQYNMKMDDSISMSSIIDKMPPSWEDFKHTLKHKKEELSLEEFGGELRVEESIRMQEDVKQKETIESSFVHMVEDKGGFRKFKGKKPKGSCSICGQSGHYKSD